MTTTPTPNPAPTTTVAPSASPTVADVDQVLTERAQNSGQYLAGLITAGMLEAAGTPKKLPHLLFPDVDPWIVDAIWNAALPVAYQAGKMAAQPSWTPEALDRLRAELQGAGYQAMGNLTARSRNIHPPRHPADHDTHTTRGGDR